MKKLIAILMMLLPMLTGAQELANFVLMPDGTYQTEDGKDFVVIPFEGKTAHQIYQELASNVAATFNDPSKVMSGVDDASIKIRAHSDDLVRNRVMGIGQSMGGYYQLEFRIKDGRVRVSAPYVEEEVGFWMGGKYNSNKFEWFVKKHFKNDKLKDGKRKEDYDIVVAKMNGVINNILNRSAVQDANEDW